MTQKPLRPRAEARQDTEHAAAYYANQAGIKVAEDFIEALQDAYNSVATHPVAGSPRLSYMLNFPELRFWRVPGFPYLIFYIDRPHYVDVLRVLHSGRDFAGDLLSPDDD